MASDLEDLFLRVLNEQSQVNGIAVEQPEAEYRFHPDRKWRFDFAWPAFKVAVEVDGGAFTRGRHNTGVGSHNDKDKMNAAAALGWRVLAFDAKHLQNPDYVFETILEALGTFTPDPM
jgi:very-short-patch-repair endonuclease